MKNISRRSRQLISWFLIFAFVLGIQYFNEPVFAAVPKMRAAVTSKNVLKRYQSIYKQLIR